MQMVKAFTAAGFLVISCATSVLADPITVLGGFVSVGGGSGRNFPEASASFSLTGDSFSSDGTAGDAISLSGATCASFVPCPAGTTLGLSGGFATSSGFGDVTINGVEHGPFVSGRAEFTAGAATIPIDGGSELVLRSPGTFAGTLFFDDLDASGRRVFTNFAVALNGTGTATVSLSRIGDRYAITGRRFDFSAAAAPTPEPASLLLLGSGAAMLVRRRPRRR